MASVISSTEEIVRAREVLHEWSRSHTVGDNLSEDVLIMLFRDWAAEQHGWYLWVHWRPGPDCYGGCWHRPNERCENDQYLAPDMHEVRLLACGGLLREQLGEGGTA
jgi:hypothetical protein